MATETQDLRSFWQANRVLSKEGFIKTHPYPFLVEIGPKPAESDARTYETLASKSKEDRDQFRRQCNLDQSSRVFRVVKRSQGGFGDKISVGRSPNNDIVLSHMSVSKFHAYITASDVRFEFSVYDVDSRNGTQINSLPIQPMKKVEIRHGDKVSFGGEITFLFLSAADLYSRLAIMQKFL